MKHLALLLSISLMTALSSGCASTPNVLEPEIGIRQITHDAFLLEQRSAPVSIEYEITIHNRSGEPIKFLRLDLQTAGGGPYILRNTPERFNRDIPAGETVTIVFAMWGVTKGGRAASIEPVVLTGVGHFESPLGKFSTKFLRRIEQGSRESINR